ncbi:hypothetical protein ABK040_015041 [Willaertia magna]
MDNKKTSNKKSSLTKSQNKIENNNNNNTDNNNNYKTINNTIYKVYNNNNNNINNNNNNNNINTQSSSSNSSVTTKKVIFSKTKVRKSQIEYFPEDDLENWLLQNNENNLTLIQDHPTHISQRGGHYHIIFYTKEKYKAYIKAWKNCIEKNQTFYIEELRTKHSFKLYIDIDLKLTKSDSPFDIVKNGWIDLIQKFTENYFFNESHTKSHKNKTATTLIVTECHSNWTDKVNITSKYKSGYRLFYPNITVDFDKFCDFTYQLCFHLKDKIGTYENQPEDWTFEDVIDLKTCSHPRCRLFGTTKWRRGELLPRIYKFRGVFKGNVLDVEKTNELENNLEKLLVLTSTRVEDPFDE